MRLQVIIGLGLFIVYTTLLFGTPLGLLWGWQGMIAGGILAAGLFALIGFRGSERIGERLKITRLSAAESPEIHSIVAEYCRRLSIPKPTIGVIECSAVNFAQFGFSWNATYLAITRGALERLKRSELSALLGWELTYLWHGDVFLESWLSQFLAVIDPLVMPSYSHPIHATTRGRLYPLKLFARQIFIYPLTLLPVFILKTARSLKGIDLKAVKLTGKPQALAEGFRILEALRERNPLYTSYSTRHLFLIAPPTDDPFIRMFFVTDNLSDRIQRVEMLRKVVALS